MSKIKIDELDSNNGAIGNGALGGDMEDTGYKFSDNIHTNVDFGDNAFGGFMMVGTDISNSLNEHFGAMSKLLEKNGYGIITISEGLEFPIIAYAKKDIDNVVYYYSTIITDDQKRALSLSNFVQALEQRDGNAFTLDVMYEANEDDEVKAKLTAMYPSVKTFNFVGSSVVRYSEDTYMDVSILINRALEAAPYLIIGKDQTLANINKNFKITYTDLPNGTRTSRTGLVIRADFRLTLSSNNATRVSKNSTNKDLCYVYGYIDLVPEEETIASPYNQPPVKNKKLRPVIIITDIVGLSATPGYAYFGILTATNLLNRGMYLGHILRHAARYNDLISITIGETVDLNKMTPPDRGAIMDTLVLNPILAIDITNNGYNEEISFFLDHDANAILRKSISGFTGKPMTSNLIDYVLPLPYLEYFDKVLRDGREIDCSAIATMTKDIRMVLGYARITNDASQDAAHSISDLAVLLNEAGLEGELIATYGRVFLAEEGLSELFKAANLKCEYTNLWDAPQQDNNYLVRQGYSAGSYFTTGFNGNTRGSYKAF